jgi:hypothetical protein
MTRYLLAGVAASAMLAGAAFAQSIPDTTTVIPGGSVSVTKTQRTIDANGVETSQTQTFHKSQTITDGNGQLSAETKTLNTEETRVVTPPAPVYTTRTTRTVTTTTE